MQVYQVQVVYKSCQISSVWFISLVRYLQFGLPAEKGSLDEDEEEDGDEADAEDEEEDEDEEEPGRKKLILNLK